MRAAELLTHKCILITLQRPFKTSPEGWDLAALPAPLPPALPLNPRWRYSPSPSLLAPFHGRLAWEDCALLPQLLEGGDYSPWWWAGTLRQL